jgi:hypothetical protein
MGCTLAQTTGFCREIHDEVANAQQAGRHRLGVWFDRSAGRCGGDLVTILSV